MILNIPHFLSFNTKSSETIFFGCQKSGSYVQAMLEGKQVDEPKWNVVRYHHDPTGKNEAKAVTLCEEIPDDVYGLTFHQDTSFHDGGTPGAARKASQLKKTLPSLLTISVADGLLVVMDPLEEENPALKRCDVYEFSIHIFRFKYKNKIIVIQIMIFSYFSGRNSENLH